MTYLNFKSTSVCKDIPLTTLYKSYNRVMLYCSLYLDSNWQTKEA
jgi:hypothetical protein